MLVDLYYQETYSQLSIPGDTFTKLGDLQTLIVSHVGLDLKFFQAMLYNYQVAGEQLDLSGPLTTDERFPIPVVQVIVNYFPSVQSIPKQRFENWLYNQIALENQMELNAMYYRLLVPNPLESFRTVNNYRSANPSRATSLRNGPSQANSANQYRTLPIQTNLVPGLTDLLYYQFYAPMPTETSTNNTSQTPAPATSSDLGELRGASPTAASNTNNTNAFPRATDVLNQEINSLLDSLGTPTVQTTTRSRTNNTGRWRSSLFSNNPSATNILTSLFSGTFGAISPNYDSFESVHVTLDQAQLNALPTYTYEHFQSNNNNNQDDVNSDQCPICQTDYQDSSVLRQLQCEHHFHRQCIDNWLTSFSVKCPLCRHDTRGSSTREPSA